MPYIGRQSGDTGQYVRCNTITPDGSTTTFALTNVLDNAAVTPGTENNVLCSLSGVMQAPSSAFTISDSSIVFSTAPDAADVVDFVVVLGDTVNLGTPSDSTVGIAKLTATGTKDSTTFLRGDNSFQVVATNFTTDKTNTGDGSTTAFTCVAGYTVDEVLVIVNGLVLTPTDDYTISSTTLTFVAAPVASAEIVLRYLG